jgi:rhodanese-related sulfurtransferase
MNTKRIVKIAAQLSQEDLLDQINSYIEDVDDNWNYITPKDLNKEIESGEDLFLLDIRKPENYAEGHIENSVNIFWLDLFKPENLNQLPKDKKIIIICYVGHTASQVMTLLKMLGYDVAVLKFGMGKSPVAEVPVAGWETLGLPTTK